MTFRPSALTYALLVIVVWILCLAVALDRVELFFVSIQIILPTLRCLAPSRVAIEAFQLEVDDEPRTEDELLTITAKAWLHGSAAVVEALPVLPPLLAASIPQPRIAVMPAADGRIMWRNHLRCRASGMLDLGLVYFRVWDKAGLWVAETRQELHRMVPVYPRAIRARRLPAPRQTGAPFGIHVSRRLGDGTDFADIRSFTAGDRMKRINWAISLRMRRLHVNQFHAERSGDVIILIDSFTNIGQRPDASLDHTLRAAASLAMGYLHQHDRVGLMDYGGLVHWIQPAAGPAQYGRLLRALAHVSIAPTAFLQDLTILPEAILPWRALIIALTPLADERFADMIGRLAEQGRDVVLFALRTDELCANTIGGWPKQQLIHRFWLLEREERLRELRRHGIRAVNWSPSLPLEAAALAARRPMRVGRTSW